MSNPEDRYIKLETKVLPNGKTVYKSAIPKSITPDELNDLQIIASDADRMDVLAHNAYGSAQSWWKIAAANKRTNGSLFFKPGTTIFIPKE
jgi:hypothetical protein